MDGGADPLEGFCGLVVSLNEGIDLLPDLARRGEAGALEREAAEDGEPDLNLVEPTRIGGGEVEVGLRVGLQPAIPLWLVGGEIVEDDMDLAVGMTGRDAVHEVEELATALMLEVGRLDLAGGDVQRGEQGRGAVPLVGMVIAGEGASVGQLKITLGALQRLDVRLLIDGQNNGVVPRRQI